MKEKWMKWKMTCRTYIKTRLDIDKTLFYFTLPKNKLGNHNERISLGFVSLSSLFMIPLSTNLHPMSIWLIFYILTLLCISMRWKSRRNETKTKTDLIISGIDIAFMNSIPHMR